MSKGKQLTGQIEGDEDILTREEVLQILSEQARKGSISAAVALERALRLGPDDEEDDPLDAELDRLLEQGDRGRGEREVPPAAYERGVGASGRQHPPE